MRRLTPLLALVAIAALAIPAMAASTKLQAFGTGVVDITGPNSATLANDAGEYSGVYLASKSQSGKPIGSVSFSFTSSGDVAGGAPRFSIPIDTDGNSTVDGYAFLDVNGCGSSTVSTDSATCTVYFGNETFANWAAFATAHPTYRIAPGSIPFIIADQPGNYVITGIDLR